MRHKFLIAALALAAFFAAVPAFAHHSFAMFDNSKWIMLKGTVVEYRW